MTPEEVESRKKTRFLNALMENGGFKEQAIRECRTSRRWFNGAMDADEEFATAVQNIVDITNEQMLVEARRRASGYDEDIVYRGEVTGKYKRYSDILLMFLIKGRMPEYRDGPGGKGKTAVDVPDDELNEAVRKYLARKDKTTVDEPATSIAN